MHVCIGTLAAAPTASNPVQLHGTGLLTCLLLASADQAYVCMLLCRCIPPAGGVRGGGVSAHGYLHETWCSVVCCLLVSCPLFRAAGLDEHVAGYTNRHQQSLEAQPAPAAAAGKACILQGQCRCASTASLSPSAPAPAMQQGHAAASLAGVQNGTLPFPGPGSDGSGAGGQLQQHMPLWPPAENLQVGVVCLCFSARVWANTHTVY